MISRIPVASIIGISLIVLAGCMTTTTGLGRDTGPAQLPTGAALLGSDEDDCFGTFHVSEESVLGGQLEDDYFVDPGENATFRLENREVAWTCIRDEVRTFHEFDCPDRATHLRITRAGTGGGLLFECYG